MSRIAGRFARVGPWCRVRDLVLGLLSDLPRKNRWSIAERAGQTTPDGMQHLPGQACGMPTRCAITSLSL